MGERNPDTVDFGFREVPRAEKARMVREVFALDARVIADPESGTPLVVPRCSPHRPSWTASDPRSGRFRHTTGWSPRATGNERVSAWSTGREARKGRT